jgi:hypothetical protein
MTPQDGLIDDRVSVKQCKLAVEALHAHEIKKVQKAQETELLPGKELNIWLNVAVKQMPSSAKIKPAKMCVSTLLNGSTHDRLLQKISDRLHIH